MSTKSRVWIRELLAEVTRRWRRRTLMRGLSVSLTVFVVMGLLFLALHSWPEVPVLLRASVAVVWLAAVLAAVWISLVKPLARRITERDISLYIEERYPDLEDRLNSAVELEGYNSWISGKDPIIERLLDEGALATRSISLGGMLDRRSERIWTVASSVVAIVFVAFLTTSFRDVSEGLNRIDFATLVPEPELLIEPGNAEVEQGADQEIVATLMDAGTDVAVLHFNAGDSLWQQVDMTRGVEPNIHMHVLSALQTDVSYYVQAGDTRSKVYTLSLYEFPEVDRIDLTYTFPAYTGLEPASEEDTGDIRGLKGSIVEIDVATRGELTAGVIRLDTGVEIEMESRPDGHYVATLPLESDGTYSVHLTDNRNKQNQFPEEYSIRALDDLKPVITLLEPLRDVRVNAIDEVLVAAEATDDYGVASFQMRFSVNGEKEQSVELSSAGGTDLEVSGSHLFYLEEYGLQAGDVISYYIEAGDAYHEEPEFSDMYFVEVMPFDQQYRQAANMGGSPMAGSPGQTVLSQQQIIAATWKLIRERSTMDEEEFSSSRSALVQAQGALKNSIEDRINQTAFSLELLEDEQSRRLVALLREAVGFMSEAVGKLTVGDLRDALVPERKALNAFLRAEALNRERQVASGRQQGAPGQSSSEDRMTELMDLELDISRDKYETPEQRARSRQSQEVNDALRRIQELARKQQNLAARTPREMDEAEQRREIERLKRDQDELRREAEELARTMRNESRDNPALSRRVQEDMNEAIDQMRQAEEALREGDVQESMSRQQQALSRLGGVESSLNQSDRSGTRDRMQRLADSFEELRAGEEALEESLEEARRRLAQNGGLTADDPESIEERRAEQLETLRNIQDELAALGDEADGDQRDVGREARNLSQDFRRESIEELMERSDQALSQGWLDHAEELQEEIRQGLSRLDDGMRDLAGSLPRTEQERLAESLEQVRDLQDQLERMREATAQNQQQQQGTRQEGTPGNEPSQDGRNRANSGNRQMMSRLQEGLERLQENLESNPQARGMLSQLSGAAGRSDHTGVLLGDDAADFFADEVFAPLSALERELATQLQDLEMEKRLFGARSEDVPPQYREMVERYYEALARQRGER